MLKCARGLDNDALNRKPKQNHSNQSREEKPNYNITVLRSIYRTHCYDNYEHYQTMLQTAIYCFPSLLRRASSWIDLIATRTFSPSSSG